MLSVIVPTMWKFKPFISFINDVAKHPKVSEVILIDNDKNNKPKVYFEQNIKILTQESNIFVNPSWNLGVDSAINENLCIMNDDIIFDLRILDKLDEKMTLDTNFGVAGAHPGEQALNQIPFNNGIIDILPWVNPEPGKSEGYFFGFGTLFFIKKSKWVKIPESLLVYYGDNWVQLTQDTYDRNIYMITNIFYYSPSAQTCTSILTQEQRTLVLQKEGEEYGQQIAIFRDKTYQEYIESEYNLACNTKSDINEHIPLLRQLASECERVVELGVREGWSTRAFLTQRNKLRSFDIIKWSYVDHLFNTMRNIGRDFQYIQASSLDIELEECDMIFFDTEHTFEQLSAELALHGNKATKYLVFHDTVSYGSVLLPAIQNFLKENKHWKIKEHYINNNGLMVLIRGDI